MYGSLATQENPESLTANQSNKRRHVNNLEGMKPLEKVNPLLPFAFTSTTMTHGHSLNTEPRERHVIDENAASIYHTRVTKPNSTKRGPLLAAVPSIKRKMGESFTEKDDVKRLDYEEFFEGRSTHPEQSTQANTLCSSKVMPMSLNSSDDGTDPTNPDLEDSFQRDTHVHCALPSSPPVLPQHSEVDTTMDDYTVPDSPVQNRLLHTLVTSPIKRARFHHISSEPDFGVDQFNRYKFSSYHQLSSTDAEQPEEISPSLLRLMRAKEIILQCFEDISQSVILEGMQLTDIPDEIKDLNELVIFDYDRPTQVSRQLYLTNNKLKVVNPSLFAFDKLNVLSLRQNEIRFLPSLISNLTNLTDLNVSINKLRYLPPQILDLPVLKTFRAGPNPFIPISADALKVTPSDERYGRGLRHVSPIKYLRRKDYLRSLKSICLDEIARYDVTYRETKAWKNSTPKLFHLLIALAISKGKFKDICNECNFIVVEPYAEVLEWWDILQNVDIPIKRKFCSGLCVNKYHHP